MLVAIFPAGNSLILGKSLDLVTCGFAGDLGTSSIGRGLDNEMFKRIKGSDDEALTEERRLPSAFHFRSSQESIPVLLSFFVSASESTQAHRQVSVFFLFASLKVLS